MSVCVSLSTLGCVYACVCMHTHVVLCSLRPSGSGPHSGPDLSPATSVPQPEIEEMLLDARYIRLQGQSYPDV